MQRRSVGVYVMLYVRTIFPATAWSMWARLVPVLGKRPSGGATLWRTLDAKARSTASTGDGLYSRAQRALDARTRTAQRHVWHLAQKTAL